MDKTTLKEKNKVGGLTVHDFKTNYKAIVTKTGRYWIKVDKYINGIQQRIQKYTHTYFSNNFRAKAIGEGELVFSSTVSKTIRGLHARAHTHKKTAIHTSHNIKKLSQNYKTTLQTITLLDKKKESIFVSLG